ncbi:HlyD family efflux transporter periplasmic adaptor subunit [Fibrella aquatilis]|uniref:HlyD family efflux transporter periplasmic adaptor subunit n=1 Tax=Fibrella aquatilis TaxID=2817059 RepID=A0A939GB36_9BACT|nr:HlyD family efflux transporter periplasmic adaptor subunit [Fibrella aquatilis]MBO0933600.1 HlyD family efflux transporter periplasmic adaptor subunit [Fibrella aquatilis]
MKPAVMPRVELRNPEVDDLMGQSPAWIVRWGTLLLFVVLGSVFAVGWFIRYPDVVPARLVLLADNPPRSVIARTEGRIVRLLVREGAAVRSGQPLAYLESTTNHAEVLALMHQLDVAGRLLQQNRLAELDHLALTNYHQLGELQTIYQPFAQTYSQLQNFMTDGFYQRKMTLLQQELTDLQALHQNLLAQQTMQHRDIDLAREEYAIQQTLADQKVIAPLELKREESKHIGRQLPAQQLASALINSQLAQRAKQKELIELTKQVREQRDGFGQALNTLQSAAYAWKARYVLSAPVAGRVSWLVPLYNELSVKAGQELGQVVPTNGNGQVAFTGEMRIGQYNFGKVKTGQDVLVKLPSYPFQEYGLLVARVEAISPISTDTTFRAQVSFPNGLRTTTGHQLIARNGLVANGEIITDDTRLIEKLFYELRRLKGR